VVWRRDLKGEARVTADPASPRVAYVAGDVLTEIALPAGSPVRQVGAVRAARYDGAGSLVVADADGRLRWLAPGA
jgi:hypothetical protein